MNINKIARKIFAAFEQKFKTEIADMILNDKKLFDKIINDFYEGNFKLGSLDSERINYYFSEQNLKYILSIAPILGKYISQNQIYGKYKKEIDQLIYENQKRKDIYKLNETYLLKDAIDIIQKYNIEDQNILEKLYNKFKNNQDKDSIKKIVDRIDNRKIKGEFERSLIVQSQFAF